MNYLKLLVDHHAWMLEHHPSADLARLLPDAKLRRFAAEADSLDATAMRDLENIKRIALAATLVCVKTAKVLDDLGDLFVKRMLNIHRAGKDALERYQLEQRQRIDALIRTLKGMVTAYQLDAPDSARIIEIGRAIGGNPKALIELCEQHEALSGNNYYPFLWRY